MWAPKSAADRQSVTLVMETTYADEVKKGKQKEFLQQSEAVSIAICQIMTDGDGL